MSSDNTVYLKLNIYNMKLLDLMRKRIVQVIEPTIFQDDRGYFFESYRKDGLTFIQDNEAFRVKGSICGLHYQDDPHGQAKLVRVVQGKILDVAVNVKTGEIHKQILSAGNKKQMFVPIGFAHGYVALEDSIVLYKCTNYYYPDYEKGFLYSSVDVDWIVKNPILSKKDLLLPNFP